MKILRSFSRVAAFAIVLGVSGLSAMNNGPLLNSIIHFATKPIVQTATMVPVTLGGLVLVQKGGEWVWGKVTAEKPSMTKAEKPSMTKNVIKAGSTGLIYAAMNKGKAPFGAAAATGSHFVLNAIENSSAAASIAGSASAFVDAYIGNIELVKTIKNNELVKTVKSYVSPYSALGKYIAYVGMGMVIGKCIDKKMVNKTIIKAD